MESLVSFRNRVSEALAKIDPTVLSYHEDEFWMIRYPYEYLDFFAEKNRLYNTAIALPLARGLHDGSYRKNPIARNGKVHLPPYFIHCLTVTKTLADMWLPLQLEELDILLAASLCHDTIEDIDFPAHGLELTEKYGLDRRVYETVKHVSKRKDFTPEEEKEYFLGIERHPLALLIKLSDRCHNVTDLYNMSDRKIREYIGETRTFFLPMCDYGRAHYAELREVIELMQNQLVCLTKTAEMTAAAHLARKEKLMTELEALRAENAQLREACDKLWEEASEQ